jgi:hypothetical protein
MKEMLHSVELYGFVLVKRRLQSVVISVKVFCLRNQRNRPTTFIRSTDTGHDTDTDTATPMIIWKNNIIRVIISVCRCWTLTQTRVGYA